jgi:spore coat polysaccharide biosynthesis protein SpsF
LSGKPLIWHVIHRLKFSKTINNIILATTTNSIDDKLSSWAMNNKVQVFRGDENNVLNRYVEATKFAEADVIVRITADDPFKEHQLIDEAVNKLIFENADFVCNNFPPTYPEGLDVEVFTKEAILIAERNANTAFEKEHVTQYFYLHPNDFRMYNLPQ